MNYINLLYQVRDKLKEDLKDVIIKLTPWQSYAGQGYDKLSSGIVVLVNLGDIYHNIEYKNTENSVFGLAQVESSVNINISIGKRNLGDEDDFSIEEIAQELEKILTNLNFDGCGLFPKTISTGVIDDSMNYWRHLTFGLTFKQRLGG